MRIQQRLLHDTTSTSPELSINIGHRRLVTKSDATSTTIMFTSYIIFQGLQVCPPLNSNYILSLGINLNRVLSLDGPTEWSAALFENLATSGVGP